MKNNTQGAIYNVKELGAGKTVVLGLQHMFAMFGSTVLVPLLTGLDVATTLLLRDLEHCYSILSLRVRYQHSLVHLSHS